MGRSVVAAAIARTSSRGTPIPCHTPNQGNGARRRPSWPPMGARRERECLGGAAQKSCETSQPVPKCQEPQFRKWYHMCSRRAMRLHPAMLAPSPGRQEADAKLNSHAPARQPARARALDTRTRTCARACARTRRRTCTSTLQDRGAPGPQFTAAYKSQEAAYRGCADKSPGSTCACGHGKVVPHWSKRISTIVLDTLYPETQTWPQAALAPLCLKQFEVYTHLRLKPAYFGDTHTHTCFMYVSCVRGGDRGEQGRAPHRSGANKSAGHASCATLHGDALRAGATRAKAGQPGARGDLGS